MQRILWYYRILVLFITVIIVGCTRVSLDEMERAMQDAQESFEAVESLELREQYPNDYQEAQRELLNAEKWYVFQLKRDDAYAAAKKSRAVSQRIIKQFYQGTIGSLAREAKAEIEKITEEDPDNPLKDFLPRLNELLDYSEKLESGQEVIVLNKVIKDLNDVINIKRNADNNVKIELESDVSFATGEYELSNAGKRILKEFFDGIIADQKELLDQNIGKTIIMRIKVVGYTDQQGFSKGSDLRRKLLEGEEDQVPQQPLEQRRFLNHRLSQLRASTIGGYIKQLVELADARIDIAEEIVGRGEEVPPGVSPTYSLLESVADAKRRICKIYSSFFRTRPNE